MTFKLENLNVGNDLPPIIVAEISGNHDQNLKRALELITLAKQSGAHAVKFQTYTANSMTLKSKEKEFKITEKKNIWNGEYLYDLYEKASTPYDWHDQLFKYSRKLKLVPFSTPFDKNAVDLLENLNCCAYKIASFEITDLPLIKYVASTGKPIIMSTGMASREEISEAVETAKSEGNKNLILLKCTSTYPADAKNANLKTMIEMKQEFNCLVGLSDHTLGVDVSLCAVALGACMIEKHFTINRDDGAIDSKFSLEPHEFNLLSQKSKIIFNSLGNVKFGPANNNEALSKNYRRSIYACTNIKKGEVFSHKNIKIVRPSKGLEPKEIKNVIGKKAKKNIKYGIPIKWNLVQG